MSGNYNHTTPATFKSSVLIEIRNTHTAKIAAELVRAHIVPNEYLDKLLRIDMMNQLKTPPAAGFDDTQRIAKLIQLLQKHSIASTASFISNLSFNRF
jgi:hypothetical protein